jgi:hypothetical protein
VPFRKAGLEHATDHLIPSPSIGRQSEFFVRLADERLGWQPGVAPAHRIGIGKAAIAIEEENNIADILDQRTKMLLALVRQRFGHAHGLHPRQGLCSGRSGII